MAHAFATPIGVAVDVAGLGIVAALIAVRRTAGDLVAMCHGRGDSGEVPGALALGGRLVVDAT